MIIIIMYDESPYAAIYVRFSLRSSISNHYSNIYIANTQTLN
jgi:hypothetical protein